MAAPAAADGPGSSWPRARLAGSTRRQGHGQALGDAAGQLRASQRPYPRVPLRQQHSHAARCGHGATTGPSAPPSRHSAVPRPPAKHPRPQQADLALAQPTGPRPPAGGHGLPDTVSFVGWKKCSAQSPTRSCPHVVKRPRILGQSHCPALVAPSLRFPRRFDPRLAKSSVCMSGWDALGCACQSLSSSGTI